ncbi:MAG: GAF domain-containing protein, partial [Synechococcaceae cyanobacterium SM2_3_60]|nr:GAF domain-containing protein [Synechococcaceae cyanobacterium SM2_3_60]
MTQAIRDSLDLTTIFATATRDVTELFQLHSATIVRYEPEHAVWRHICDFYSDPEARQFSDYAVPDHDNPFAARLKRGEIVNAFTDRLTDPINQAVAQTFPGTWLLLPLRVDGQTWGSLSLHITDPNYVWSAVQVDLAQLLANQLA